MKIMKSARESHKSVLKRDMLKELKFAADIRKKRKETLERSSRHYF